MYYPSVSWLNHVKQSIRSNTFLRVKIHSYLRVLKHWRNRMSAEITQFWCNLLDFWAKNGNEGTVYFSQDTCLAILWVMLTEYFYSTILISGTTVYYPKQAVTCSSANIKAACRDVRIFVKLMQFCIFFHHRYFHDE